jgi:putative membrane protein
MIIRWIFAALHLLALGIGLGAISQRGRNLRGPLDPDGIRRVLHADNLWGLAAVLWIVTGLVRAFGGLEKGTAYYLNSSAFWIKMGLLIVILLLEIWPAVTFVRWRIQMARGQTVEIAPGLPSRLAAISLGQAVLVTAMIFAATALARGLGF